MGLIRSRQKAVTTIVALPDHFALQAQSLGAIVNPVSPASRGIGATSTGLRGSDVNMSSADFAPLLPIAQALPLTPNLEPGSLPTADGPGSSGLDWITWGQTGGMGG